MKPGKGRLCVSFCFLFFVALAGQTSSRQDLGLLNSGVVVEKVLQHSEAEKAGIQEGDILLRWTRDDVRGEIESPFDLSTSEIEQAPRDNVFLEGLRGQENKVWKLGQERWGIQVRPNFPSAMLTLYREGQDLATAGNLSAAAEKWRAIGGLPMSSSSQWLSAWLSFHLAEKQADRRHWEDCDLAFQDALAASSAAPDVVPQVQRAWAGTLTVRGDWERAAEHLRKAIPDQQTMGPKSLGLALVLDDLGTLARRQSDLNKADGYYQQALHIREELAPDSLSVVASLNHIGDLARIQGDLERADRSDQRALTMAEKIAPGGLDVAECLGNLGDVAFHRGKLAARKEYYSRSLEIRTKLEPGSLDVAEALARMGLATEDTAKGEDYERQALAIREKLAPGSLDVASSFGSLASFARDRGDLAQADEYHHHALTILEKLVPGSLDLAMTFNDLGNLALDRGELTQAEEYYRRALAIRNKLAPRSPFVASTLNNLGLVAEDRGDLAQAEEYYQQFLENRQRSAPRSLGVAVALNNLGNVALERGNLAQAEEHFQQALAIRQELIPGSMGVASCLNNLGDLARVRKDLARAENYYHQALEIKEKLAPGSVNVASSLNNLAVVSLQRGELTRAEEYGRRALAIREKLSPGSLSVAESLRDLGLIAHQHGDLGKAEEEYRQALTIHEKLAPAGLDIALNLNLLALLLEDRGEFDEAEQSYRRASAIWEKLAPGSSHQADALAGLASIDRQRGELDRAGQFYEKALEALESQTDRLGSSNDVRAGFRATYENYYRDYASLLMQQGRTEEAFQVLERSRARTLLEMLVSSHLDVRRGVDPALLEKERSLRADLVAKSSRRIRLLGEKHSDEQIKAVESDIRDLTNQYDDVKVRIRSASSAYAALTQPHVLNAEGVQHLLPENTLLLEYSLGEPHSYLFAITTTSLHSYELPRSRVIEQLAQRLYQSLSEHSQTVEGETEKQRQSRFANANAASQESAAELSREILGPVAAELTTRRLLIVGDGALLYIPFAVLPLPESFSKKRPEPLVLEHEIAYLPSASVLPVFQREQKERGTDRARKEVAVFADPVFDKGDSRVQLNTPGFVASGDSGRQRTPTAEKSFSKPSVQFRDTLARSAADANLGHEGELNLPRLAFTRQEAKAILRVVPQGSGMEALGFDASRSLAASGELRHYRVVHFATHALVDNIHPELSGLVLSLVDRKGEPIDGFLDLEDIYNLDLSADLVVLSACDTALGKELRGEGMIGLTQGFMYAGAARVMATLWNVNDFATAKLMAHFYQAMEHDGMKPAQALRQAQLAILKQDSSSAPYYWAGFVLQGDW